jgi:adenine-specific DNA-methyltransferase
MPPRISDLPAAEGHALFFGDSRNFYNTYKKELSGSARLVYLDPPYNSGRSRGARKYYNDNDLRWPELMEQIVDDSYRLLREDGFLAVSINLAELFNLKNIIDRVFTPDHFIGLFPVKIRHRDRQLMINATYHDVYEYLLIYRKNRTQRFECDFKHPDTGKFTFRIQLKDDQPLKKIINGKNVEIYRKDQYEVIKTPGSDDDLRRYMIAGKLKTANWSGEWFETHLRQLGKDLLIKVYGLEKEGLGYRWFETQNTKRASGIYYQSHAGAGRPVLPSNDLDFTDEVTSVFKEGGEGCDFKDSKKPEKLMAWLLSITTKENDLVIDLFAGSGTTLAVCEQLNRRCYSVEKHEEPYKIAVRRMSNLSAQGKIMNVRFREL